MEEKNYGINWIGLFIKVIVFVIIVLLAIWLISKIALKNKGLSFEENNQKFIDATVEYFKNNLPEEGKTFSVTLNQLISWDYLEKLTDEDGNTCDVKKSNSKIEVIEDYYSIKSVLVCGNKLETTYTKLGNEECTNCDIKVEGLKVVKAEEPTEEPKNEQVNTNETSKGSLITNNQPVTNNQTILYEYVKETQEYSDWYVGNVTGTNVENSTMNISYSKYCENTEYVYRTISYAAEKTTYTYKLELVDLYNVKSIKVEDASYFNGYEDYQAYSNKPYQDLEMVVENKNGFFAMPDSNTTRITSLNSNNFTFSVSQPYQENGKYYVYITIRITNLNGATPYYASRINSYVYFAPVKFTVSYTNKNVCVVDRTDKSNDYGNYVIIDTWNENVNVYRQKLITREYKYSNVSSLEGYVKTGNTKIAG